MIDMLKEALKKAAKDMDGFPIVYNDAVVQR